MYVIKVNTYYSEYKRTNPDDEGLDLYLNNEMDSYTEDINKATRFSCWEDATKECQELWEQIQKAP